MHNQIRLIQINNHIYNPILESYPHINEFGIDPWAHQEYNRKQSWHRLLENARIRVSESIYGIMKISLSNEEEHGYRLGDQKIRRN